MTTTITVSLPLQVAKEVETETIKQQFASRSEFIRSLIRKYFAGELQFQPYISRPLSEVKLELAKTGKYSEKFIDSVLNGLSKSSFYDQR